MTQSYITYMVFDEQPKPDSGDVGLFTWGTFRFNKEQLIQQIPLNTGLMVVIHPGFAKYYPGQWKEVPSPDAYREYEDKRRKFIKQGLQSGKKLMIYAPVDYLSQTLGEIPKYNEALVVPTLGISTLPDETNMAMSVDDFFDTLRKRQSCVELLGEWKITCVANAKKLFQAYQIPTQISNVVY